MQLITGEDKAAERIKWWGQWGQDRLSKDEGPASWPGSLLGQGAGRLPGLRPAALTLREEVGVTRWTDLGSQHVDLEQMTSALRCPPLPGWGLLVRSASLPPGPRCDPKEDLEDATRPREADSGVWEGRWVRRPDPILWPVSCLACPLACPVCPLACPVCCPLACPLACPICPLALGLGPSRTEFRECLHLHHPQGARAAQGGCAGHRSGKRHLPQRPLLATWGMAACDPGLATRGAGGPTERSHRSNANCTSWGSRPIPQSTALSAGNCPQRLTLGSPPPTTLPPGDPTRWSLCAVTHREGRKAALAGLVGLDTAGQQAHYHVGKGFWSGPETQNLNTYLQPPEPQEGKSAVTPFVAAGSSSQRQLMMSHNTALASTSCCIGAKAAVGRPQLARRPDAAILSQARPLH
ncbi:PREDICTED: uncharacterized protein LOC103082523 [Lipotes vexillifer]|uniref:Uncharacterized protein LOC103082523 n=1 Tax=Lipotes vexillifer TaxID=118797 RepID=A0A340XV53_LIPVE|nr:PREDICTED: uncharacterized protein LOC103082523 [Lipotes vexillifer]